jgi:hypothetical protein
MKTTTTLLTALMMLCLSINSFATIRYVNNNVPYPSGPSTLHYVDFATCQSAGTTVNGDTIYIQGSPTMYVSFTVTKQLTIIGPGFNTNSYNGFPAIINGNIIVAANVSGVKLIGLKIIGRVLWSNPTNNLTVKRCYLSAIDANDCCSYTISGLTIEECFITSNSNNVMTSSTQTTINNFTFRNNLCNGGLNSVSGGNAGTSLVYNNVFVINGNITVLNSCSNFGFSNNIVYSNSGSNFSGTSTVNCNNNILYPATQSWPNGTNYTGLNPNFVNVPALPVTISFSQDYHLQSTSPSVAKGADNTENTSDDIGLYGGINNFTMTGVPAIPLIRQMSITNTVIPAGTPLNVNFISTRKQ